MATKRIAGTFGSGPKEGTAKETIVRKCREESANKEVNQYFGFGDPFPAGENTSEMLFTNDHSVSQYAVTIEEHEHHKSNRLSYGGHHLQVDHGDATFGQDSLRGSDELPRTAC
jgi:hypothetical protein